MGSSHSAALKWRRRGRRRRSRWGVSFLPLLQSQFFRTEKLDGILPVDKSTESEDKRPELYVECALYIDGVPFGLPMRTRLNTTGPPYC
ncbi:hypothetical protein YC2023_033034 [Brassica napus]|uniref:(rape) hypothetical protein n=1 Tax=Brassica napus TaxID=3708 RepID=A0A816WI19_BRANA|nr:unnamed protein product [Brassica napus]